jgi:hypothetical protein
MPELPHQIRLGPGDCFMHGQDRRMRNVGLPGNICHAIHRLDPGLDVELLRQRIATSPLIDWLSRVRITRPLRLLAPVWRAESGQRTIFRELNHADFNQSGEVSLPQVLAENELHAASGPSLAVSVVTHPDKSSHLVFSWNHALLDARGADLFLRHLFGRCTGNGTPGPEHLINPNQQSFNLASWWRNVNTARGSVEWLNTSGREPLFSLVPGRRPPGSRQNRFHVIPFSEQERACIDSRCEKLNAGFRRSHFYLASSVRAIHAVAQGRGNKTGAYLIPTPHDTRRRGANGPIFSNHLSILFHRIEPRQAGSVSEIMAELGNQMTDQIRSRFPECCMAALDMFKPLPLPVFVHHLGKPTRGKFATFCFSDSGEALAGMTDIFGGKIREVTHLVPAWRPPGLTVVFLSFNGRLSALLSAVDDCLSSSEVIIMERALRLALLKEPL